MKHEPKAQHPGPAHRDDERREVRAGAIDVERLEDLSIADLRDLWSKHMRRAAPPAQKRLLIRELAWWAQERVHGGLDAETRRLLDRAIRTATKRDGHSNGEGNVPVTKRRSRGAASTVRTSSSDLPPATKLSRVWRGVRYEVYVLEGGRQFRYRDQTYGSLSEIAREITGTRWSGPRFFGMTTPIVRCAVYTRKSSEEGLDMAFNSLDAQREAGVDYIKSQKHQGWTAIATTYDDGGYSGGSTDRPGLQRLLDDIHKGRVDVVVVYKVDRLSRSLADFAQLMQTFDEHNVSFVSVTQQFNTTTSMGRLTLNMLLSFAQFEREVAGERIRDKIAATKRKGVWVCGQPPLGYRLPREGDPDFVLNDRTLRIIQPEAELIRLIFSGYLELGSLVDLAAKLNAEGHTTKHWTSSRGKEHGGRPLTAAFLYRVLTNPVYIGKIAHTRGRNNRSVPRQTEVYPGHHEPIIDQATWDCVHTRMGTIERESRQKWTHTHLLKGKIRTFEGHAMSPGSVQRTVSKRKDVRSARGADARRIVRYYVSQKAVKQGFKTCPIKTVNAAHIDDIVRGLVLDHLKVQHNADLRGQEPETRDRWIREVVHRVMVAPDRITVELVHNRIAACIDTARETGTNRPTRNATGPVPACPFTPEIEDRGQHLALTLHIQIKRHDGRRVLLSPDGHDLLTTITPDGRPAARGHLVRAVGLAFAWRRELLRTDHTVESVAQRAGLTATRVHSILTLTQLSPPILRSVLTGALGSTVTLADLLRAAQHLDWSRQAQAIGA